MNKYRVKELLSIGKEALTREVMIQGWVRAFRSNRFISLNDGSTSKNIQAVVDFENFDTKVLEKVTTGAALKIIGEVVESQGKEQDIEILAKEIQIYGEANPEEVQKTILQPKKHSLEKLREQAHLRFRTNLFSSVMRVRHALSFAIHEFFNQKGFYYIHTPIITHSDAEGAGETFGVTNLDLDNLPKDEKGKVDYAQDFFGKKVNLTVSGQLEGELAAMALGNIYTFGPTFRAENSNTTRHLAEFWMIEPEMAFYDLDDTMDLSEEFVKYILKYVLDHCQEDLNVLNQRFQFEEKQKPVNQRSEMNLIEKLQFIVENNFKRVSYNEAIEILKHSKHNKKKKFQYLIEEWGIDLQSEHERYLVEKHFKCPVILFDYPANIKAFYMRLNEGGKTVRAMDVLFPGIGEMIGGSQREERYEVLKQKMTDLEISHHDLWWYLDTRKFGTAPHSGFGLGFERLVMYATGMGNIRDVIPFPRTPNNCEF